MNYHVSSALGIDAHTAVLVEGVSDRVAVEAIAERRGRDLTAEGVAVVAIGGATNIRSFLDRFARERQDLRLAGLCDLAEESFFRRGLELAGLGVNLGRADMESLGFFVCVVDLEDELIRSLGVESVVAVIGAAGDMGSLRTFLKQPAQQGRTIEAQLRRFMGTRSGRKERYGRLLVGALDLERVPRPLDQLLSHV